MADTTPVSDLAPHLLPQINLSFPKVSIIVLNYNGKRYLDECLNSLKAVHYPSDKVEVLVVDNGSTDGSQSYIREHHDWVKAVTLQNNLGFCGANNLGAKVATGELLVFLNNDVIVDPDWLRALVEQAMIIPTFVFTSKAYFADKPHVINHNGSKLTLLGRGFCSDFGRTEKKTILTPKLNVQPYGASMMVSKVVFKELGCGGNRR